MTELFDNCRPRTDILEHDLGRNVTVTTRLLRKALGSVCTVRHTVVEPCLVIEVT